MKKDEADEDEKDYKKKTKEDRTSQSFKKKMATITRKT